MTVISATIRSYIDSETPTITKAYYGILEQIEARHKRFSPLYNIEASEVTERYYQLVKRFEFEVCSTFVPNVANNETTKQIAEKYVLLLKGDKY